MTGRYAARGRVMIEVQCIGVRSGRKLGLIQKELKPCSYEGAQKAIYSFTPCHNCIISCGFSFSIRRPHKMEPSRWFNGHGIARLMTRCDVYRTKHRYNSCNLRRRGLVLRRQHLRPAHQLMGLSACPPKQHPDCRDELCHVELHLPADEGTRRIPWASSDINSVQQHEMVIS